MNTDFLESYEPYHHGIQGQKWGERRYQYQDGSLTPEGKRRYGIGDRIKNSIAKSKEQRQERKAYNKELESIASEFYRKRNAEYAKNPGRKFHLLEQQNKELAARAVAGEQMVKKYGRAKFTEAMGHDSDRTMARFVATELAIAAIGTVTTAAIIVGMEAADRAK